MLVATKRTTHESAHERILSLLRERGEVRETPNGHEACCPSHDDTKPSLQISRGDDGRVLVSCLKGCPTTDIVAALGLGMSDLFERRNGKPGGRRKAGPGKSGTPADSQEKRRQPHPYRELNHAIVSLLANLAGDGKEIVGDPIVYEYRDRIGDRYEVVFAVVRFNLAGGGKEIRPIRRDIQAGVWFIGGMPDPRPLYHLDELEKAGIVVVAEGEKAADLWRRLGYIATTTSGGSKPPHKTNCAPLAGKELIVIAADNDKPGAEYADKVAALILKADPSAKIKQIAFKDLGEGADIAEFIEARPGLTDAQIAAELAAIIDAAPFVAQADVAATTNATAADGIPEVIVGHDEHRVTDEAFGHLKPRCVELGLFQANGQLVNVVSSIDAPVRGMKDDSPPTIRRAPVHIDHLRHLINCAVRAVKITENDDVCLKVPTHLPHYVPRAIAAKPSYPGVPVLTGYCNRPVMTADGRIIETSGYDAETGLMITLPAGVDWPRVKDCPDEDDVGHAINKFMDPFCDVPFSGPAHKAACFAAALTPFARQAYNGNTPLIVADASTPGSGKGLSLDIISLTASGREMPRWAYPSRDEECEKIITSAIQAGIDAILFDNVSVPLGNSAIDAALTSPTWSGRALGSNRIISGPMTSTIFVTGNNITYIGDTLRRSLPFRLVPNLENPEGRTGFKYPDVRQAVREMRPQLVHAAHTILRWFINKGRPNVTGDSFGSFEGWSNLVRQCVTACVNVDPLAARGELRSAADTQGAALRRLAELWAGYTIHGELTTTILREVAPPSGHSPDNRTTLAKELHDAIVEFAPGHGGELPTARVLGKRLGMIRGRVVGGYRFESREDRLGQIWRSERVGES